ncbi:hypothetical protein CCUS01_11199 [Colletotrichum cuscutae]|uniref:Uncharacterized protein n=1 Tax=Colletotrichum cuscutae TaxID=1209917 RepID=A0AAI9U5Y1_9PEZI|nr:hypothetical protein CCUS01_11199 [Colletotrichum cuscutae]
MKSVCVPQSCGLCRYQIVLDETIVAVWRDGAERSQPFSYSVVGFPDSSRGIEYVQCRGKCHHDEKRIGCHLDCYSSISIETFSQIYEVTAPDFESSHTANCQRSRWLRSWLVSIIRRATHSRLPLEVCSDVAVRALDQQTSRRMAVWYAERKCGEFARNVSQVALSKKIYVRYAYFEGTRYIARLTNAATNNRDILVFDPLSQTPAARLYVSSDHLGIRQLLFVNSSSKPAIIQEPDVWWKTICLGSLGRFIRTRGDGSKMRVLAGESLQLPQVAWGLPQAVYKHLRLEPLCNAELTYRMSVVPCNHPPTTAYSLCWNQSILTLYAHTTGENFDFYHELRTMDESALWFYMPLCVDGVVTEIWKCDGSLRSAIALLLVTNQERSSYLGVQPQQGWSRSKWTLLDRPTKNPSSIYLMKTALGSLLGFESPKPRLPKPDDHNPSPRVEWPTSSYPKFRRHEYFAWTSAKLGDVVDIIPCRRNRQGSEIISGLLLRYIDGQQACVGQIRLDQLQNPICVDRDCKMWFKFSLTSDGPIVSGIEQSQEAPSLSKGENWFRVDWCGDLEWWYSKRQCQLSHQGRLSPETMQ